MVNGKSNPVFAFICVFLMGLVLHDAKAALQTKFIEDLCHYQESVNIDLRYQPTGILISLPQTQLLSQVFECEVFLSPPKDSSVVVSIYRYDVMSNDSLTIEDSDRFKIALTGFGYFKDEKKAFISDGRMVIRYRRKVIATSHQRQGFQFTFTAVKKDGPCYDNEFRCNNRLCLLKEYVCDGHNHCGDGSDQKRCVPKDERISNANLDNESYRVYKTSNVLWISIIGVAGAIVFIILIVFIVVVIRTRKAKAPPSPNQDLAPNSNNQSSGGNVPLQSVSSTVPQQQPNAPTTGTVPSAPPAPDHEGFSFYNRVRRSIRGLKNPKPEDASKEIVNSEVYQVPSMYPNLDQQEPASSEGGIVNTEFKIEE